MTDERKLKLIRILSETERRSRRNIRGKAGRMYHDPYFLASDREEPLTRDEIDRELKRQIAYTIPWLIMCLLVLGIVLIALIRIFRI